MDKKERKLVEEKIALSVSEIVKTQGFKSSALFLKSVRKHSKAIAKKLMKELAVPIKKTSSSVKPKKVTAAPKTASTARTKVALAKKTPSISKK